MAEPITEMYCENCGQRHEFGRSRPGGVARIRRVSRGLRSYVLNEAPTLGDAMADAWTRLEAEGTVREATALGATFTLCLECRRYVCHDCWNPAESLCRTCAPTAEDALAARTTAVTAAADARPVETRPPEEPIAPVHDAPLAVEPEVAAAVAEPEPEVAAALVVVPTPMAVEPEVAAALVVEPEPEVAAAVAEPEPEVAAAVAQPPAHAEPDVVVEVPQPEAPVAPPRVPATPPAVVDGAVAPHVVAEAQSEREDIDADVLAAARAAGLPIDAASPRTRTVPPAAAAPPGAPDAGPHEAAPRPAGRRRRRPTPAVRMNPSPIRCRACGLHLPAAARYCRRCGVRQGVEA